MDEQYLERLLGLARRAGKIVVGYDPVLEAAQKGETDLVLFAADCAENTKGKLSRKLENMQSVTMATVPFTKDYLVKITGKITGVCAVTDQGFTKGLAPLFINNQEEDANARKD